MKIERETMNWQSEDKEEEKEEEEEEEEEEEAVIVALDANRSKGTIEALEWTLKHVVHPRDIVLVLGVFNDQHAKKHNSCFPLKFFTIIGVSGIWDRLEVIDHEEIDPVELEEEFKRKRGEYRSILRPLYRQCRMNGVRMVLKLAAGFCPARLAIAESQNLNTRWIVLDNHFRESKVYLRGHVTCNIAVVKEKELATLMFSKDPQHEFCPRNPEPNYISVLAKHEEQYSEDMSAEQHSEHFSASQLRMKCAPAPHRQNPCCYPLSWRSGFPRAFSHNEIEVITNGFSEDNIISVVDGILVYQGILQESSVIIKTFPKINKGFWSRLKILSRVHHRNILNLVGYCSNGVSGFMLFDFPCLGNVGMNLECDELAEKLGWRTRWSIALEVGGSLRYLHEECVDGPIVHKYVCAFGVALSHGYSAMLGNFTNAKWLTGNPPCNEDLIAECPDLEGDERLFIDVHDYGKFLLELITGKSASHFQDQGKDQSLIDWALPLLENGKFGEVRDSRLTETAGDAKMVRLMAHAALRCLKVGSGQRLSISKALAIVRGDKLAVYKH